MDCTKQEFAYPLKFVIRVIRYKDNKKIGTTQYRIMEVDIGNCRRTTMRVDYASTLYQIRGNTMQLREGSYAMNPTPDDK